MKFEANEPDMSAMFEKEKQARYNYSQKLREIQGLLRYCELDALAMVMIFEAGGSG